MKDFNTVASFLEQPIPRDEVATRDGGRGKRLSYLETWKVIDLLNEAFGNLGWDSETVELVQVSGTKYPTYYAKVRITALVKAGEGGYLKVVKEGCGWGADKSEMNAHEMAVKEAESDALKRAAMKFGKRLGLALYDKSQEFVTDGEEQPEAPRKEAPKPAAQVEGKVPASSKQKERNLINTRIRQTAKVLADMKRQTLEATKALVDTYGVESVDQLSDQQAEEILAKLEGVLKK